MLLICYTFMPRNRVNRFRRHKFILIEWYSRSLFLYFFTHYPSISIHPFILLQFCFRYILCSGIFFSLSLSLSILFSTIVLCVRFTNNVPTTTKNHRIEMKTRQKRTRTHNMENVCYMHRINALDVNSWYSQYSLAQMDDGFYFFSLVFIP